VIHTADGNPSLELCVADSQGGDQDNKKLVHLICQEKKYLDINFVEYYNKNILKLHTKILIIIATALLAGTCIIRHY